MLLLARCLTDNCLCHPNLLLTLLPLLHQLFDKLRIPFCLCVVFVSFSIAVVFGYPAKAGLRNWLCCWTCPSVMMNERRRVCCYLWLDCVRGRWRLLLWMCIFCLRSASAWLQQCTIYFPLQMVLIYVVLRRSDGGARCWSVWLGCECNGVFCSICLFCVVLFLVLNNWLQILSPLSCTLRCVLSDICLFIPGL